MRTIVACALLLAGCSPFGSAQPQAEVAMPPFPECAADAYAFAGRGTLRGVGLVGHSRAELPEPDRPAMIWVTADLLPFDAGAPGGAAEMTRMLCFEFDDGSGGSEWPVDEAWQPPVVLGAADQGETDDGVPIATLVLLVVIGLISGVSAFAFRRR